MMAARAGAAAVVTCEANPAVAVVASEIIARNGFANRVRVVAKNSADLAAGIDFDGLADVLVIGNASNNIVSDGALPAAEQAVRRFVRPGARIIPARGVVRVALAEDRQAHEQQTGIVDGFDLSPFNRFSAPHYQIRIGEKRLVLRSVSADLFRFDFQSGGPFPEARAVVSLSTSGGLVNGIVQWIRLEMDEDGWYENMPAVGATSAWAALFYPLMRPIDMAKGGTLTVCGSHDRLSLRIWAQLPEAE